MVFVPLLTSRITVHCQKEKTFIANNRHEMLSNRVGIRAYACKCIEPLFRNQ